MKRIAVVSVVFLSMNFAACKSGPPEEVAPTRWQADFSTAVWGPGAGSQIFGEGDMWQIDIIGRSDGSLSFQEWARMMGDDDTTHIECDAAFAGEVADPYVIEVDCEGIDAFEVIISGDTMTYTREANIGTISGTFNRGTMPGN